jgi:hypothetical protein
LVGLLIGVAWGVAVALFRTAWRENRGQAHVVRQLFGPLAGDLTGIRRRVNRR